MSTNFLNESYDADFEITDDDFDEVVTLGVSESDVVDGSLSVFYSNEEVINIIPDGTVDYRTPEQAIFELLKEVSSMKLNTCGLKVVVRKR